MNFLIELSLKINKLVLFFFLITSSISAQTIMVGALDKSEDYYRNRQLLGKVDSLVSFCIRPLSYSAVDKEKESLRIKDSVHLNILPLRLVQQYNTFAPLGWNDGSMIPARGYQSQLGMGIRVGYKKLALQLNPEFVFADNPPFDTFPLNVSPDAAFTHILYLNHMDAPERFGTQNYLKAFWGQSSLRLNVKKISMGVSTENLWWGPGMRNSLIMSNNAPGFLHFTINTRKPIVTWVGSFEGQFISGKLDGSGYYSPDADYVVDGISYKTIRRDDWRYINGITVNYQPKWVPGLFVGMNRVFQIYSKDLGHGFSDFFPVITPFQKKYLPGEDAKHRDQLASLYLRWVLKESKAEFYFENGWNDSSEDLWDLFESPSHSSAYIFGFTKLFPFRSDKSKYVRINVENTHMEQSADQMVRDAGSWYYHGAVWHGYTNQGQVMGAGIGPGSNSQTLDVSLWKEKTVTGVQFERYAHNLDYYYRAYNTSFAGYDPNHIWSYDYNHKWVDMNINAYMYRRYGNLGVQIQLNTAFIRNYEYVLNSNQFNFQTKVSLQYFFN